MKTPTEVKEEIQALRQANEAFGKRQEWWNERMFQLESEVERLTNALQYEQHRAEMIGTIIRMAREAKLPYEYDTGRVLHLKELEHFAALVAAAEREACARECAEVLRKEMDRLDSLGRLVSAQTLDTAQVLIKNQFGVDK